jgi:hypothetical protein
MYHILGLFMLSPLLSFILFFKNILKKNSKFILISFFTFYGATMIFPVGTDGSRHLLAVEIHYLGLSFPEFLNESWLLLQFKPPPGTNSDLYLHILSFIASLFGIPKVLYVLAATIYGYFYVNSIKLIYGIIAKNTSKILWLLFFCLVLWKSFEGINSIRNWTAAWVVFYGTMSYLLKKEKKFIYLIFLAYFIHFSYVILTVPILIAFLLPKLRLYYFAFYIASLFISIPLSTLESNLSLIASNELAQSKFEVYNQDSQEIAAKNQKFRENSSVHKAYAISGFIIFFQVIFVFLLVFIVGFKRPIIPDSFLILSNIALIFFGFSNLFMFVPSLSKRLELNGMFYLLIFIVLSYNLINVNKVKSLKKLNFLIVVGIPFILLFMFMQISYIAEYTNIFVIVAPFLLLFFYDETISIKNVGKELFNSFS